MPRSRSACIILFGIFLRPCLYSQPNQPLPSAEAVLDRSVAASGGHAAYDHIQNEVRKATIKVAGISVAETVGYWTKTGKYREITRSLAGQSELGVNNGIAWSQSDEKAQILETGEERAQMLQQAELLPEGHWRRFYKSAELLGTEMVEGKNCYILKVVPLAGEPHTLWYDQKTGLQVREVTPVPSGAGDNETTAEEYFDVGGIRMPRVLHAHINGLTLTIVVDDVKFDQSIPDSAFAVPPAVERLMSKRFTVK